MPIETDNKNIDFGWRFNPTAESQQAVSFSLRLHKTADFGWTISFLNESGQPEFSLPTEMFSEIGEFISQHMNSELPRAINTKVPGAVPRVGMPQVGRQPASIASPKPQSKTVPSRVPLAPQPSQRVVPRPNVAPVDKITTADGREFVPMDAEEQFAPDEGIFIPEGHTIPTDIELNDNEPIFQSFTTKPSSTKTIVEKPVDETDQADILAERQAAIANPNKKPGIKKRHTDTSE